MKDVRTYGAIIRGKLAERISDHCWHRRHAKEKSSGQHEMMTTLQANSFVQTLTFRGLPSYVWRRFLMMSQECHRTTRTRRAVPTVCLFVRLLARSRTPQDVRWLSTQNSIQLNEIEWIKHKDNYFAHRATMAIKSLSHYTRSFIVKI
jgi:hypothetical protein